MLHVKVVPIDTIGQYDATKQPAIVNVDEEKALAWLAKGAQPTDTVPSPCSKTRRYAKIC